MARTKRPAPEATAKSAAPETPATLLRRERRRIAQVLHDTVCQELTGICLMATVAGRRRAAPAPEAREKLLELAALIQRAGSDLAGFVAQLRAED